MLINQFGQYKLSMSHPFTKEELVEIEMSNELGSYQGHHHHHHHHHHVEYKQPEALTTEIGLYALKKLNAMNPTFLRVREARVLDQVNPGTITSLINISFFLTSGMYATYVWRTLGPKGFASAAVIPFVALVGAWKYSMVGVNWLRDGLYSGERARMVEKYKEQYGEEFLLNALNPGFRL